MNFCKILFQICKFLVFQIFVSVMFVFLVVGIVNADDTTTRGDLSLNFHNGLVIDNFASNEFKHYLNPNDANDIQSRYSFGFNFEALVPKLKKWDKLPFDVWIFGSTDHGMRSTEVNCNVHPDLNFCKNNVNIVSGAEENLYILRNATSLEGILGVRFELPNIFVQDAILVPYFNVQLGFITVSDSGGDLIDVHHGGIGLIVRKGDFRDSHFEIGYGRTDLFTTNNNSRIKFIGKWIYNIKSFDSHKRIAPFAKIVVDTDFGNGSDNVQSYLGISFYIDSFLNVGSP